MPVSSMDQFGHRFNFFMNGQTSTKTLPGFIFTLLAASLSVASFYIFYNAMVDRTTPTIQVSKVVVQDSKEVILQQDLFFFVLLVNFGTLLPRNFIPLFGKVKVELVYEELTKTPYPEFGNNTDSYIVTNYDLVPCNETQTFKKYQHYMTSDLIAVVTLAGLCVPDLSADQQMLWTLRSTTGEVYSQKKVSVQLLPCQLPAGCTPWIGKKDLMFYISTVEKAYNGMDYNQPVISLLNAENRFLPLEGWHKSVDIAFSKFISKTDSGLLFSSIKEESGIRYEGISPYDYAPWGGTVNSPLITVNLVASLKQTLYTRSYGKITGLISNLGGIMQVTLSLIAIIYSIYNQYVRKRDLVVYGIMDMLPPDIEGSKKPKNCTSVSGKTLTHSIEEQKSPARSRRGTELNAEGLNRQKTTFLETRLYMGSFWKYICFRGNQRHKRKTASLKSLQEFRRYEYWNDCERLLAQTTELTVILPMMNELEILRAVFFTNYHERLAPRIGIYYMHQDRKERLLYQNISSEEVAEVLKTKTHVQSIELYSERSSRDIEQSPRNNVSIIDGGSLITGIKNKLSQQVIQKYEDYKQREKANFDIFSGIKEFLESAAFVGIKDFLNPNGTASQSRQQTVRNGSTQSRQESQMEILVDRHPKKPSLSRAGLEDGWSTEGRLLGKDTSIFPVHLNRPTAQQQPVSLVPPAAQDSPKLSLKLPRGLQPMISSNRMIKNAPKVVSNQRIGVSSNPQLVRVKLAHNNQVPDQAHQSPTLNGARPITVASSTQHIHLHKKDDKDKQTSMQEDLQVEERRLASRTLIKGPKPKPRASKEVRAPVLKKPKGTRSLQWIPAPQS